MRVLINQFVLAHGKKPSGFGSWAFKSNGKELFILGAFYSEALREAKKEFGKGSQIVVLA